MSQVSIILLQVKCHIFKRPVFEEKVQIKSLGRSQISHLKSMSTFKCLKAKDKVKFQFLHLKSKSGFGFKKQIQVKSQVWGQVQVESQDFKGEVKVKSYIPNDSKKHYYSSPDHVVSQ